MSFDPAPWRVIASRRLVDDRWMHLRADACETAEGHGVDPYYVIEGADWTAVVAITHAQDLVLVRQYRHALGRVILELPGGEIDASEDAVTAARRELAEETGYVGGEARLVHSFATNPVRFSNWMRVVIIAGVEPGPRPAHDAAEQTQTVFWPLARSPELFLAPDFSHSALAAALAAALTTLNNPTQSDS